MRLDRKHRSLLVSESIGQSGLFPHGQMRLARLSVFNWGSFKGLHHAEIDPQGTLVTGDNGAGKSTLIDGLTALLLPSGKASFNIAAAQGDRTDRSLVSYVRGSYGRAQDGGRTQVLSKRNGATISAVAACYRADDGSVVTLAGLFWLTTASSAVADVARLFLLAHGELELAEVLKEFEAGQKRAVKTRYRDDAQVVVFDQFSDFQEAHRRVLHLDNANAPALLARALGLKKIDDLTRLIREFVLEPSRVRESARKAVTEFEDLVATHRELEDTRRQRDTLAPLPSLKNELDTLTERRGRLEAERSALPAYLARQEWELWARRTQERDARLQAAIATRDQTKHELVEAQAFEQDRHADYLKAGGDRIQALEKDLDSAQNRLKATADKAREYQTVASELNLDDRLDVTQFRENQARAVREKDDFAERQTKAQDAFGRAAGRLSEAQALVNRLSDELLEVERRPDSNIDPRYLRMRDELAQALDFSQDELVFIGEMLDVRDQHTQWQGAIERALGGLRTTLAVPADRYSAITAWLNARHLGLHVRVQTASTDAGPARFGESSFLHKLNWREHPYRDWLKHFLSRHDLACVASTSELDRTPFSLTQEGLIHRDKGRFEKKDLKRVDDRRDWCLGFSNRRRLATLQHDLAEAKHALTEAEKNARVSRGALNGVGENIERWKKLLGFDWNALDLTDAMQKRDDLSAALEKLRAAGGDLEVSRLAFEGAKVSRENWQVKLSERDGEVASRAKDLEFAQQQMDRAKRFAELPIDDLTRDRLDARVGQLRDPQLDDLGELRDRWLGKINGELSHVGGKINSKQSAITGVMGGYRGKDEWRAITAEWGLSLADLPSYLERLEYIDREGLPELVEKFRERLNRHTTQSLAGIRQQLNNELDDIRDRIETINSVLVRTEFRAGTHLQIRARREEFPHVREFNQKLGAVLAAVTSDDHEKRFVQLVEVVEILEKASAPATASSLESQRLLDPRFQLSFLAEDIQTATGDVLDVLDSSSGKSGGEKEAFAGTIVAASLAYVLTPEGADFPVYCTVFLDEAFSNTAEAVSRRVLRVFRELHLHVNLVTPFKNLNLARESARSLLIIERNQDCHESRLSQVTWEEIDRRLADRAGRSTVAQDIEVLA